MSKTVLALLLAALPVGCASSPPESERPSRRVLPRWQDQWSDGGSFVPDWNDRIRQVCVRHDEKYSSGGSEEDRLRADRQLGAPGGRSGFTVPRRQLSKSRCPIAQTTAAR